ncbi:MAG: type II secretion system F family protein [Methylococcaceae bacterium]|nr:type II secretion system F family protein [Methylococcaceae bacterium]
MVGVVISLFGIGVFLLFSGIFDPVRRRVRAVSGVQPGAPAADFSARFVSLAPFIVPKKVAEVSATSKCLIQAGFRSESATTTFYAIKLIVGISFPAVVILAAPYFSQLSNLHFIMVILAASMLGMRLPNGILNHLLKKRQRQIINGFPDAIDLLVACVEAGMGLNAAIKRVADEIVVSYPALGEELATVTGQIQAGIDRVEALRELYERTGLDEIRGLVSALSQSFRFGTSVAATLRVYSEDLRDKRMQRAEEQAAKIGTKMIFPLIFCIFPAFFIVAIGPAILGVLKELGKFQ